MEEAPGGREGHVVVVGDDGLAVRVLEELLGLGVELAAVSPRPESPLAEAAIRADLPRVVGDPARPEVLREAGAERARAVALLANADLPNLHAALVLHDVAPDARVVLRLPNSSTAESLADLLGDSTVLSAVDLAAPAFVEAALRGSAGPVVRVGDHVLAVREVDGGDPTLRLALAEAGTAEPRLFPQDAPRVVGLVEDDPAREAGPDPADPGRSRRLAQALRGASAVLLDRRLAVVGAVFALVVVVSTLVFQRALGIGLVEAFYFVAVSVTTTGYGDINLLDEPDLVKLYGSAFLLFGGLVLAVVFALVTDAVVGARLARALGQHPFPERDHVVVCGIGGTGGRVLHDLVDGGASCVAVDRDEDAPDLALARRLRVPTRIGDAGLDETLGGLRLDAARALVAVTGDDVANLQCALLARVHAPRLRIVLRLTNADLAGRVERAVGIQLSRSPYALAAPAFVAAVLGEEAAAVVPVGHGVLHIATMVAQQASTVAEVEGAQEARVIAVDGAAFPPRDLRIRPGAEVVYVGTGAGLARLDRRLMAPSATA
jgi:Trk K+ transport system NAD-binding subunit